MLAIQLNELGVPARSLLGHQARILTDNVHRKAHHAAGIDETGLRSHSKRATSSSSRVFRAPMRTATLRRSDRGGSDTSAVAIAAAVEERGVFRMLPTSTACIRRPGICPNARKLKCISYEEMLELSSQGAKVLQIRSVELAMKHRMPIHVRSSYSTRTDTS